MNWCATQTPLSALCTPLRRSTIPTNNPSENRGLVEIRSPSLQFATIFTRKKVEVGMGIGVTTTMRDRSKNRKPLQRGRNLSIEAIQTVQALKRAKTKGGEESLEELFDSKFRRLLKFDMMAVLREFLRQNECLLALKVFEDVQKEHWYKPQVALYAEMVKVLGSNGLFEKVELLFMELKMESDLEPDTKGFNALLESLMSFNITGLAMECFSLMKSLGCEPDRSTFRVLINGLESNGETSLSATVRQEAQKYYGESLEFLEEQEEMAMS